MTKRRSAVPDDRSLFDLIDNNALSPAGTGAPALAATVAGSRPGGGAGGDSIALHEAAQARYLNYALSVITSRALPDVRDGLKPVQRRILYTMWQQGVTSDARHRKSAKIVGDVMGSYHPHGDAALYETLVRMAQPFSLRYPLVEGSGNFGSLDGDGAAAMRYTECRLAPLSHDMLAEIEQDTVSFRPNYDGTRIEPVVLPARFPNLLVNGASGIAVGMATNIPPHNLDEVCTALVKLLANPELTAAELCRWVKGPDFPTGGQILNTATELEDIYKTGAGSVRLRATWENGPPTRAGKTIHVTSVPYTVNKSQVVERIAEIALGRKLPALLDVKDLSAEDVRISIEIRREADERMVMAYLFRHTPLQTTFPVNLTCLVPTENQEVGRPERSDLKSLLWHFLHFRLEVVTKRLEHERAMLERRIHVLEGFEKVFDVLDEILRIVRKSEGKADAAAKIMARYDLDAVQTDQILELKIYRLARLEIQVVRKELQDKRRRSRQIASLLRDETARKKLIREEIEEIRKRFGGAKTDRRRTIIEAVAGEVEFSADDFIVDEDSVVIVSRDGWVKRQKEVRDLSATRLREGDSVLAVVQGSTRATAVFFTNFGTAYSVRIADVPASTGYGEPVQRLFKFRDRERVVGAVSLDPRVTSDILPRREGDIPATHAVAVTSDGYAFRFGLGSFGEPSTRSGRRYWKPNSHSEVVGIAVVGGSETMIAVTAAARAILCPIDEINYLSGPGKGVILLKMKPGADRILGFVASKGDRDLLTVETSRGALQTVSTAKYEVTSRGGKGRELLQRGQFVRVVAPPVATPPPLGNGS